jgi:hypothetical protein
VGERHSSPRAWSGDADDVQIEQVRECMTTSEARDVLEEHQLLAVIAMEVLH